MNSNFSKKLGASILIMIFVIQPLFQFFTKTATVQARWQTDYYDNDTAPLRTPWYNPETETITNCVYEYKYTVNLYGAQHGIDIWESDLNGLDGKLIQINNPSINNQFTVKVASTGSSAKKSWPGYLFGRKYRKNCSISVTATYTSDWTTYNTNDGRYVCSGVSAVGLDGAINTTMKPRQKIEKKQRKVTWTITSLPPKKSGAQNTSTAVSQVSNTINNVLNQYQSLINGVVSNNKPSTSGGSTSGSPLPGYSYSGVNYYGGSTSSGGTSSGATSSGGSSAPKVSQKILNRTDLNENARRLYIRNLYKRVLGREPSNDEISGHFKNNSQKEAYDIIFSKEADIKSKVNQMTNEQFVTACYNYILGRAPDKGGKSSWIKYLSNGNSRQSLVEGFVDSEEFVKNNNKETTTLTFSETTATAVYESLRNSGYSVIKPTNTTVLMYKNDVNKVEMLDLSGKGLTDLTGIKQFANLKKLAVSNNKIADLSKVSELTNLEQLYINNNNIKSLDGIEKLTKLNILNIGSNQLKDITKLSQLSNIKAVNLNSNQITSLNALENVSSLKEIYADYNSVETAPAFKNVDKISVVNNRISLTTENGEIDLPAILNVVKNADSKLYTSENFECSNCRIENNKIILDAQTATVTIKGGSANGTKITIGNKTEIVTFNDSVLAEKVKNAFGLSEIKSENGKYVLYITNEAIAAKKSLDLSSRRTATEKITDITGLEKLSQLTSINLRYNNVSDFSALRNLNKLETLDVRYNGLTSLGTLKNLTQLKQLDASNNEIADISGIENLTEMQDLLLSNNKIGNNIQAIANLQNLSTVSLIGNGITDISGLVNLKAVNLYLDRNGIGDISVISKENVENLSIENNNVVINVKGAQSEIPAIIKKAMELEGGSNNIECTGCTISDNKLVFDDGIKLAQIKIKAGELRDTIVTIQDEDAINPPNLEVSYQLSSDNRRMTVTITADKPIQNVLSWTKEGDNVIKKDFAYNVSNQNIVVRDLYGNETKQLVEFTGVKHPRIADLTVSYSESMLTNKDVTITISSSENLAYTGGIWTLNEDKKSASTTISENTNHIYTTAIVLTEKMYNIQMQPVNIDIEVANIDKKAPVCEVEYDVTDTTKSAVKATIWSDEEIEAVNAYDYTKVVKVEENGAKKYGIVLYYTNNANSIVTVRDLAFNLSMVEVKIENIDTSVDGLYAEANVSNSTTGSVTLTVGADEEISVSDLDQQGLIAKIKRQPLNKLTDVRVANTVLLDSMKFGYNTPSLRVAETPINTSEDGKKIEITVDENELDVLVATDKANNKDLTLINTSAIDKNEIDVTKEETLNEDGSVTVTLRTNKPIIITDNLRGWDVSDDLQVLTKTFKENQNIDLELEDFAGNKTTYQLAINSVEGFEYSIYYYPIEGTDQVLAIIEADRELQDIEGWELSTDKKHLGKTLGTNEKLNLNIYDINGIATDVEVCYGGESAQENDEETQSQAEVNDNTQSDKPMPQTGEYVLFAILASLALIVITGITLIKYGKE